MAKRGWVDLGQKPPPPKPGRVERWEDQPPVPGTGVTVPDRRHPGRKIDYVPPKRQR